MDGVRRSAADPVSVTQHVMSVNVHGLSVSGV